MTGERPTPPAEEPSTLDELFGTPAEEPPAGTDTTAR